METAATKLWRSFTFKLTLLMKSRRAMSMATWTQQHQAQGEIRIFIAAGEVSGDTIGGRLMSSLKRLSPRSLVFSGIGGVSMASQGLQPLFPIEDLSVMGLWELLPHLWSINDRLRQATEAVISFRPHAVVTIDSKGFSFRLLKNIRAKYAEEGVACPLCFHYVAPSFWAWKGGERPLSKLAEVVDHVLCILPFEEDVCRRNGLAATFVGHPVLEDVIAYPSGAGVEVRKWHVQGDGSKFRKENGLSNGTPLISVLPGSRLQEVMRMLPTFGSTIDLLKGTYNDLRPIMFVAPNAQVESYVRKFVERWEFPVILVAGNSIEERYNAFNASDAALCTSGTSVLEVQLARLPCVVAYRASPVTEWIIKLRTKLSYISLPNILMDSPILPEALFSRCTPERLAYLIRELVQNEDLRRKQITAADRIFDILSPPQKAAKAECFLESDRSRSTASMMAASTILVAIA